MANLFFQGKIIRQFWGKLIRQSTHFSKFSRLLNVTWGGVNYQNGSLNNTFFHSAIRIE